MKNRHVKDRLSEYIDGVLSPKEEFAVKEHLHRCPECLEDYEEMVKIIGHMSRMERLETPDSFVEKVHERMERPSSFQRLVKRLFFPLKTKIPLELAGLAAAALLVIYIVGVRGKQHVYELAYAQRSQPPAALNEQTPEADYVIEEAITVIDKEAIPGKETEPELKREEQEGARRDKRFGAQKAVAQSRTDVPALAPQEKRAESQVAVEAPTPQSKEAQEKKEHGLESKEETIDKKAQTEVKVSRVAKAPEQKEPSLEIADEEKGKAEKDSLAKPIPREEYLEDIIFALGGKIVKYEFNKDTQILESLVIEIPANTYQQFVQTLEERGDILKPYPIIKEKNQKTITIRLILQ
jgi:hypothetical protein